MRWQTVTSPSVPQTRPATPFFIELWPSLPLGRSLETRAKPCGANHLNHLIELLPESERRALIASSTTVELPVGDVLCRSGEVIRYAYFPLSGFISLIAQNQGEPGLEVGLVGAEGMLGASLCLGVDRAPLHALVQGPGAALRIGTKALCREVARNTGLRRLVHTYLYVLMAQLATSSSCVRYHEIGPRLARWLLMTGDRAGIETFRVTHELLAHMLGVRRVGITIAAGALQRSGVIAYRRGVLSIIDRHALEAAACSCYAADSIAYSHFLGTS